jgi:O-antigen/teichoic acid export membrane protein
MHSVSGMFKVLLGKLSIRSNRDVLVMVSGSFFCQGLLFATTPFLSRYYSSESFGLLGLYMSLMLILGVGTTGKYELAIVVPQQDDKASSLSFITLALTSICCVIITVLLFFFETNLLKLVKSETIDSSHTWLYLLPLSIWFNAFLNVFTQWCFRKSDFKTYSVYLVVNTISTILLNIGLVFTTYAYYGLILAYIGAQVVGLLYFFFLFSKKHYWSHILPFPTLHSTKSVFFEYINFPKYQLPSQVLNTISGQAMVILLTMFFPISIVGQYSMAYRITSAGSVVFGGSFSSVFKMQSIKSMHDLGNCKQLYISFLRKTAMLSAIPVVIILLFGPTLFSLVLGEEWTVAGSFARVLIFMITAELFGQVFSSLYQVTNNQKTFLRFQIIHLIALVITVCLVSWLFGGIVPTIIAVSLWFIMLNSALVYKGWCFSLGHTPVN